MNVKEVLLYQIIQQGPYRDTKTALEVEEVDVLMWNAVNVAYSKEWVVAIDNIRGLCRVYICSPLVAKVGRRVIVQQIRCEVVYPRAILRVCA